MSEPPEGVSLAYKDNDGDQIYYSNVKDSNIVVIKDSAISVCSLNMRK